MNTLNNYFDKIFVVNLDERKDKWADCTKDFKRFGLNVERISGVKGNPNNLPIGCIHGDGRPNPHLTRYPGAVGCALSHLKIIKRCKAAGYKRVLILEDDIEFFSNMIERFNKEINDVPNDWDLLYLSANNRDPDKNLTHVKNNIHRTRFSLTTHAYAITDNLYDIMIETIERLDQAVDAAYVRCIQCGVGPNGHYNCYVFSPALATQRIGFSDIGGGPKNYQHVIK